MGPSHNSTLPCDAYAVAPEFTVLPLDAIIVERTVHPRNQINAHDVKEIVRALSKGDPVAPPVVFREGSVFRLADGFTRVEAHRQAGNTTIECGVLPGSRREAIEYAIRVNAHHGRKLTRAEMRRAVNTYLDEPENHSLTNYDLARLCGCSHTTVGRIRETHPLTSTFGSDGVRSYRTKHGTRALMRTSRIGSKKLSTAGGAEAALPPSVRKPGDTDSDACGSEPASAGEPLAGPGSVQLRLLLTALRQGQNLDEAAHGAGISIQEAELHLAAEQAGEYTNVVIPPKLIARAVGATNWTESSRAGGASGPDEVEAVLERLAACGLSDPERFGRALGASHDTTARPRFEAFFNWFSAAVEAFSSECNSASSRSAEETGDDR